MSWTTGFVSFVDIGLQADLSAISVPTAAKPIGNVPTADS